MKKILIASKELKDLGMHQVISTMDTNECTTETKTYYNGEIYKKETYYHKHQTTTESDWNGNLEYYTKEKYAIIII